MTHAADARTASVYQKLIAERIALMKGQARLPIGEVIDPRHVEASMRLQYGTLDHLSVATFDEEILLFVQMKDQGDWESTAQSYGL